MYVAKRRAKPIVSASGSSWGAPRVREMNSISRVFAPRCAFQSSSSERSRTRSSCGVFVPSMPSSSPPSHVRTCTPFVIEVIGTSSTARSGQRSCHISRETFACSFETPFAKFDVRSANGVIPKTSSSSCSLPSAANSSHEKPHCSTSGADVPADELRVEHLVSGGHGRVRREHGRRAQPLDRGVAVEAVSLDELAQALELEERRVAFVHVEHRRLETELAEDADAADAEHELLAQPVLPVAAVQRVRHVARPVGVALDLRVEQVERDAADLRAPHADAHGDEVPIVVRHEHRRRHRHERQRQAGGVVSRVPLGLAVAVVQPLAEVAAEVEEADADERNAELGRGLQVVAGEDSEAAGVCREALVQAELGGEVRDEEVIRALLLLPPRHLARLGLESFLHAAELHRVLGRQRPLEVGVGELGQHRRRVVQELAEALAVELGEELPRAGSPTEREVARDVRERSAKRLPVMDLCGGHSGGTLPKRRLVPFGYPESFDRQLGDRVTKRLKSPWTPFPGPERDMVDARDKLEAILGDRIGVLDGSWGVLIQRDVRGEEAYRGERFRDHPRDVAGDPDLLNLTRPEIVRGIHRAYFEAGADIATTNTFTATSIGQADYGLEGYAAEMSFAGAQLAREVADEFGGLVAGSVGPLNVTLSLSPKVEDPAFRAVTFDDVATAYAEQMVALRDGGVDILLIETIFDSLNAKAAIVAAQEATPELPLWISFTAVDRSGRNLSGQTVESFWVSIEHAQPLVVGVNCSLGATEMRPFVEDLSRAATTWLACYPNAGLPNEFGGYDEQPHDTSSFLAEFAREGLVNIVGGCCGTTPDHVREMKAAVEGVAPRRIPSPPRMTRFSGLEPFAIGPDTNFVMIGERTNVTGSARFRRLIEGGDFQQALDVALEQVRGGANLIDVNMDADLLEGEQAMTTFLNLVATEPEIARLPIMVDSSRWTVLQAGLKCMQGKGVVNSLSLKEGEESFLEQARTVHRYGAGVVVMAFDEKGQAETVERKVSICERAYRLLVDEVGFAPEDIVFDPNVLAVATGIEEHENFAKAFIEALPLIKERCPGAKTSGGISNLSFSFRGNDARARGDALRVPLPRDHGGPRHGHRQRRPARGLRGHRAGAAGAGRGRHLQPAQRRDRAARRVRRPRARARERVASSTCPGARRPSRSGSSTRSCTASSTSSRRTPRRRGSARSARST